MQANKPTTHRNAVARVAAAMALAATMAASAAGQRVQIPATSGNAFGGGAFGSPAATQPPAFDPYALGAPPASGVPYSASPPVFSSPPLPATQPYSAAPYSAAPYSAAPSSAAPYSASPYAAAPSAAPSTSVTPLFPGGSPVQWQPGTYQLQGGGTTYESFTRFLAELSIDNGYLYGDTDNADDLEVNELEITTTFTFPIGGNLETPLLVTPGIGFNFFEGPISDPAGPPPRGPDIPALLYDTFLDAAWFPRPLPAFGADLGLRVGVYSDFDNIDSDSVRVLGRGLGILKLTPTLDLVAGVVYLDRIDVSLLPAGGIHYRPNDIWEFYAVFPSPRVTRRLPSSSELEFNWFVSGEYGGGSWTANRAGLDDRFDYNDLRVTTGFEWRSPTGRSGSIELGYVFDRELIFDSGTPGPSTVDDTFLFRAGIDL